MAKSSIHIENGHAGYLAHNDRSQKTVNSIFPHNKNTIWNKKEVAFELFRLELEARSAAYTKRTGQKLQKKTTTHLSAIVNLNKYHSIKDVAQVGLFLQRKLGTKVFQIAIHRDEGHIADDGKEMVNYHAHIEFLGLDKEGRSVRQKLKRKMLNTLQSEVAEILGMERGTEYAKERKPRPKRLNTYEYKAHKKEEDKTVKAKSKDLTQANEKLKAELKDLGAMRKQHAKREKLNRDLKARIKAKDLTNLELKEEFKTLKTLLESEISKLKSEKDALELTLDSKEARISNLENDLAIAYTKPNPISKPNNIQLLEKLGKTKELENIEAKANTLAGEALAFEAFKKVVVVGYSDAHQKNVVGLRNEPEPDFFDEPEPLYQNSPVLNIYQRIDSSIKGVTLRAKFMFDALLDAFKSPCESLEDGLEKAIPKQQKLVEAEITKIDKYYQSQAEPYYHQP